ncbi:adenosine receptor A2a-like [Chironomus tepperi]|uniref:adenosine receptor A2a-like n=1 Tax=Chironomus tepperi TaxID=113505 RepID=UPI00391F96AC
MSSKNNWNFGDCCENHSKRNFNSTFFENQQILFWNFEKITFIFMESIVAIFAMLGNILVIIVFFRERKLRRKTNYYIISLATADFLVGFFALPFAIFWIYTDSSSYHRLMCLLPILAVLTLCNISVFSLLLISIDRILSINLPLNGSTSSKNVAKEIGICWILGILIGCLPLFWHKESDDKTCSIFEIMAEGYLLLRFLFVILIPAITMIMIYINIYKIIIRQMKKEILLKKPPSQCKISDKKHREEFLKREVKVTINISSIIVIFIVLWIPLHIAYILPIFCKSCYITRNTVALAICIAHSNSAINPILYAYHMRDIRKAILNLIGADK